MTHFHERIVWLSLLVLSAAVSSPCHAANAPALPMLFLQDGDFMAGRLVDCDQTGVLRWQMRGAARPFDFPAAAVRAANFPPPDAPIVPTGDYAIELSNGDLLYGSLVSVSPERFAFQTARFGRLHVARGEVRRLMRWIGSSTNEYRGPNGLAEWQQAEEGQWREEAGQLIANTARARVQKRQAIPSKARIEFEIAGGANLEFALMFTSDTSDGQHQQGFFFEVWKRSLVVLSESEDRADLAHVCELNAAENRVQLVALVDQELGRISVHALDGRQLAAIEFGTPGKQGGEAPEALEWITIHNGRGNLLRLERLAIGHWNGQLPPQIAADKPGLYQADGTVVYGDVVGYDANAKQFVLRRGVAEDQRIDAADVVCVFLAPDPQPAFYPFRLGTHDGSRVSGEFTKVAGDKILFSRPGIEQPLVCAASEVRSLARLSPSNVTPEPRPLIGWLELDGVRSHGSLIAATATDRNGCLVWQPRQCGAGSPLDHHASGRIVYREPPRPRPKADARTQQERQRRQLLLQQERLQVIQQFGRRAPRTPPAPPQIRFTPNLDGVGILYLLAGDRIPCQSIEIDEEGVHFKSSVVDATFAPHSAVKALELVSRWTSAALAEEKRARLLTLPRMQRNNPPTHLVASTNGDLLRANLVSLSADTLVVESRLETKRIPRDRVACLIWLHDEPAGGTVASPAVEQLDAAASDSPRLQALRADGVRLTFVPQECTGTHLTGLSKLLGKCSLEIRTVDVLVLGSMIETLADEQPFHDWSLSDAIDPRYASNATQPTEDEQSSSTRSGFIGRPAPDFRLDLLDGGEFRLSHERGHVVLLDFWASWCGPCMQSLPQVDAIVAEFAERGVKLVAVNLQEDRAAVQSALERLKVKPAVALDVDGAAAEHFQVTAIPHTVVIDKDGNVAQVFIGARADLAEQLHSTIEGLLTPRAAQ